MNKGGYQGGLKPTGNPPKPDSFAHNHGTEEGKGLSCRERMVNGELKGECMTELTPERLREAADVVEDYNVRCKGCDPDLIARNPAALRRAADVIEAEKAEKAERDKAIEELCEISVTGALLTVSLAAAIYDAGWRKR